MFTAVKSRTASALILLALAAATCAPAAAARPIDTGAPGNQQSQYQDLRAPDTRDAAEDYHPTLPPEAADTGSGFDWLSAAIGAAAGTGLMILAVALAGPGRRHSVLRI